MARWLIVSDELIDRPNDFENTSVIVNFSIFANVLLRERGALKVYLHLLLTGEKAEI